MKLKIFLFTFLLTMTAFTNFSQTAPPIEPGVSRELARWRAASYSDVRYKLSITLEKQAPLIKGKIEISVYLNETGAKNDLILDWRTTPFQNDKEKPYAKVVAVNDKRDAAWREENEHLVIGRNALKTGENSIEIEFASPIKTSGAGVTRYFDKEDGAEYVYSLFVPSDASTAFPVFDQPDLKAKFQLSVIVPPEWNVISNTQIKIKFEAVDASGFRGEPPIIHSRLFNSIIFEETKPISTYVFAFAAGEFAETSVAPALARDVKSADENVVNKDSTTNGASSKIKAAPPANAGGTDLPMKIYFRKSQAEKFKQHSAEVFRLNREAVKYLEEYFDYKFPFPKYDLVLIPEFPFGGMEHAGATFLREDRIIFPTEPTKNDFITRANLIFHEAAHQWFGDTVTMKWFDDLWLKEGFAEFMAYKTLERVLPEYNAWKIFYERNKQAAYLTDSTRGTTPIYQEIPNFSAAKSAYGNIVYRKAPSFLKQAEFYLGEKEFQTAVRAFLKKNEFANAEWTDLVSEFGNSSGEKFKEKSGIDVREWAQNWVKQRGLPIVRVKEGDLRLYRRREDIEKNGGGLHDTAETYRIEQTDALGENKIWNANFDVLMRYRNGETEIKNVIMRQAENYPFATFWVITGGKLNAKTQTPVFVFPNYQDYGYGIFLLDEKSRDYVLKNIQTEKDDFLRAMMWGSLWDSVRETELDPEIYVELVIKVLSPDLSRQNAERNSSKKDARNADGKPPEGRTKNFTETDESTIQTLLNRVGTAMTYYIQSADGNLSVPPASAGDETPKDQTFEKNKKSRNAAAKPSADAGGTDLQTKLEDLLIEKMRSAPTNGQKITYYRAFLNAAATENGRKVLKEMLKSGSSRVSKGAENSANKNSENPNENSPLLTRGFPPLRTKDKFDIVTRLLVLGDKDAPALLENLEKTETSDEAKRYAYAARAGIATPENKAKYWNDFVNNKEISENWIESAFAVWNSPKHAALTLPYLEKALAELPNLKRNRKIFFVNGWLASFIGGQTSVEASNTVNKFLAENPNLDKDLRLKILENADMLERAAKIRGKFAK